MGGTTVEELMERLLQKEGIAGHVPGDFWNVRV